MEVLNNDEFIQKFDNKKFRGNNKRQYIYNEGVSFDIETTSFYVDEDYNVSKNRNGIKGANMYIWMFAVNDYVTIGRTWEELTDMLKKLSEFLNLNENRKVVVYVHNLAYEFQFMRKYFEWVEVFALDSRKPVKALTTLGIEFRCSLILTNESLEKLAEKTRYNKMVGDLDYDKLRHSKTELTQEELGYCYNDVLIVTDYINNEIKNNRNNIHQIPLTSTGYVRKYCRKQCRSFPGYNKFIKELTIESVSEFNQLRRAFQGGFTHANAYHVGETIHNVHSFDFTSSYPTVMLAEKFPMSKAIPINCPTTLEDMEKHPEFLYIYDVEFWNIEPAMYNENPISYSRCWDVVDVVENNGRVVMAEHLTTTTTSVDMEYIKKFYRWENIRIFNVKMYLTDYLPEPLTESILHFYEQKTTLKGVEGKESEYQLGKAMLNSIYGMMVTNTVKPKYVYENGEWKTEETDLDETLFKDQISASRFLYYPWGVFVTAYARRNLFTGIYELGDDYIYSDTDSVKFINLEKHTEYFEQYNREILKKVERYGDRIRPKTTKGEEKPIGVWDYEGCYSEFKTLGAKRYMYTENGEYHITVAGLNKKKGAEYIKENGGFDIFNDELCVPEDFTGRLISSYIDDTIIVLMEDFRGVKCEVCQLSSINLEKSEYNLSLSSKFTDYLTAINKEDIAI